MVSLFIDAFSPNEYSQTTSTVFGFTVSESSKEIDEFFTNENETTTNRSCLNALIHALDYVFKHHSNEEVIIYTHRTYVANSYGKMKKVKANKDLVQEIISKINPRIRVEFLPAGTSPMKSLNRKLVKVYGEYYFTLNQLVQP